MSEPRLVPPDELHLYIEKELAHIAQLRQEAEATRQQMLAGPKLFRLEIWKVIVAALAAVAIGAGALGYKIGSTPPAPIVIQLSTPK